MTQALAAKEGGQLAVVGNGGAVTLLTAIAAAASNPAADIDKMERLFAMHQKMVERESEMAFNAAFSRAQARMPIVAATYRNDQTSSKYAKLAVIVEAISPIYTEEGFSVSFNNADSPVPGNIRVVATLSHPQGHSRNYQIDMPLDDVGIKGSVNKTKVHATGATNSYARRYLTLMIWNLTTEDDNDAQRRPAKGSANEGAGDDLTATEKDEIKGLCAKMAEWIAKDSIADAFLEGENAGLDVEGKRYLWSLLDSKQRSALKKEGERVQALYAGQQEPAQEPIPPGTPAPISDAQKRRLEARIGELGLVRDKVKLLVKNRFGRAHFADLTQAEYATLDGELEALDALKESAPPASSHPADPLPGTGDEQAGASTVPCISVDQQTDLTDLYEKAKITKEVFLKTAGYASIDKIPTTQYLPLRKRLTDKISGGRP